MEKGFETAQVPVAQIAPCMHQDTWASFAEEMQEEGMGRGSHFKHAQPWPAPLVRSEHLHLSMPDVPTLPHESFLFWTKLPQLHSSTTPVLSRLASPQMSIRPFLILLPIVLCCSPAVPCPAGQVPDGTACSGLSCPASKGAEGSRLMSCSSHPHVAAATGSLHSLKSNSVLPQVSWFHQQPQAVATGLQSQAQPVILSIHGAFHLPVASCIF